MESDLSESYRAAGACMAWHRSKAKLLNGWVAGFRGLLIPVQEGNSSAQTIDLKAFSENIRDQNILHLKAYPAGSAGYIT